MLSCHTEEEKKDLQENKSIYMRLRDLYANVIDQKYLMDRLEKEFKESLEAAGNNKTTNHRRCNTESSMEEKK